MPLSLALSRKRASSAMAIASAKPMPTKPLVATVSPERMRLTASRADVILPSAWEAGALGPWAAVRRMDRLEEKEKLRQRLGLTRIESDAGIRAWRHQGASGWRRIRVSQCRTRNGRCDLLTSWAHSRLGRGARLPEAIARSLRGGLA